MKEQLRQDFISKFTIWNDKFRYATLKGKEEYPTPDDIADWWLAKIDSAYSQGQQDERQGRQSALSSL